MTFGMALMAAFIGGATPAGGEAPITEPHVWRVVAGAGADSVAVMPVEPGDGTREFFWMVETFRETTTPASSRIRQIASVYVVNCSNQAIEKVLSEETAPDRSPPDWRLWGDPDAVAIVATPRSDRRPPAPVADRPVVVSGTTMARIGALLCDQDAGYMPELQGTWTVVLSTLRDRAEADPVSLPPYSWAGEWRLLLTPSGTPVVSRPGRDRPGLNATGTLAVIDTTAIPNGAEQMLQEATYACTGTPDKVFYNSVRERRAVAAFAEPFARAPLMADLNTRMADYNPENPLHIAIRAACADEPSGETLSGTWSEVLSQLRQPFEVRRGGRR